MKKSTLHSTPTPVGKGICPAQSGSLKVTIPKTLRALCWTIFAVVLLTGCNAAKHLEEGQYLIKNEVKIVKGRVTATDSVTGKVVAFKEKGGSSLEDASAAVRTRPNRRWLIPKTYLHLYNAGKTLTTYEYPLETYYRRVAKVLNVPPDFADTAGAFLMRIGKEPYLLDSALVEKDIENLKSVYFANGWFNPDIYYEVDTSLFKKKRANVKIMVQENTAWIIDTIEFNIESDRVRHIAQKTMSQSKVKEGDLYNEDAMGEERVRLAQAMRERGLYLFNPGMINFEIDTFRTVTRNRPNDDRVKNYKGLTLKYVIAGEPDLYSIKSIVLKIEPAELRLDDFPYHFRSDTLSEASRKEMKLPKKLLRDDHHAEFFVYNRPLRRLDLEFLTAHIEFKPGQVYSSKFEQLTRQELQNFGIFRYTQIRYFPNDSTNELAVEISAKMLKRYQFKVGAEGFTQSDPVLNSNLPGVGGSLVLKDKNWLKKGEKLDLSLKGDMSFYRVAPDSGLSLFAEAGIDGTVRFPILMVPFINQEKMIRHNPSTNFSVNYLLQNRTEFDRTIIGGNWNYAWYKGENSQKIRHSVSPLIVNFLQSTIKSDSFDLSIQSLEDPALQSLIRQNYEPLFSTRTQYQFTYSDYKSTRAKQTVLWQPTLELGGTVPYLIDRYFNVGTDDDFTDQLVNRKIDTTYITTTSLSNQLANRDYFVSNPYIKWPGVTPDPNTLRQGTVGLDFPNIESDSAVFDTSGIVYGQFLKLTLEHRRYIPLSRNVEVVTRGFVGAARPIFSSDIVPFNSRFFAGGANSLRGWQSNTLGPGTFSRDSISSTSQSQYEYLISPGGEIVLEGNAELRMHFGKYLEIALFSDVGNVWFFTDDVLDEELEKGRLSAKTFRLGWDGGIGFRADFDFFIVRLDWAHQLYSPDVQKYVWKLTPEDLASRRYQFNFGIGYPF